MLGLQWDYFSIYILHLYSLIVNLFLKKLKLYNIFNSAGINMELDILFVLFGNEFAW